MAFNYNNVFPLSQANEFAVNHFYFIPDLLNNFLIDALFDKEKILKILIPGYKIEPTKFQAGLSVLSIEMAHLAHKNFVDFKMSFDGEGKRFNFSWQSNQENQDGYNAYSFSGFSEMGLHNAMLDFIERIKSRQVEEDFSVMQNRELEKSRANDPCKCSYAETYFAGSSPITINDFTDHFTCFYTISNNGDQTGVYQCKMCKTIWEIEARYTDRPPFISNAGRINLEELKGRLAKRNKKIEDYLD